MSGSENYCSLVLLDFPETETAAGGPAPPGFSMARCCGRRRYCGGDLSEVRLRCSQGSPPCRCAHSSSALPSPRGGGMSKIYMTRWGGRRIKILKAPFPGRPEPGICDGVSGWLGREPLPTDGRRAPGPHPGAILLAAADRGHVSHRPDTGAAAQAYRQERRGAKVTALTRTVRGQWGGYRCVST